MFSACMANCFHTRTPVNFRNNCVFLFLKKRKTQIIIISLSYILSINVTFGVYMVSRHIGGVSAAFWTTLVCETSTLPCMTVS